MSRIVFRSACLLTIVLCGCSWTFLRPPPPEAGPASSQTECTTSRALPRADTVLGVLFGVGGLVGGITGLAEPTGTGQYGKLGADMAHIFGGIGLGIGVISALLYGLSAHYGYTSVGNCGEQ